MSLPQDFVTRSSGIELDSRSLGYQERISIGESDLRYLYSKRPATPP